MLSEFRSTNITWDKATSRIYSPVTANESDENGRKLVVQIVNGGQVEDLTGTTLHLYWETRDKLHDGLDVFKAVDLKKGEFELSYTTGMLSNKGVLNANLVLIDTVGRVVSDRFKITVTEGIDNDAIQSENSFSSLTQALIDIGNLEQNYAPRLNDLTAQLQQTTTYENFYRKPKVGTVITNVGDSTTEIAPALYERFALHTAAGGLLEGATVHNRGQSGGTLHEFVTNTTPNGYHLNEIIAMQSDLYVLCYGINDIRAGIRTKAQIRADLKTAIDRILVETDGYILLRTPNTFTITDHNGFIVPLSNAQLYSDQLHEIYESFRGYDNRVDVLDIASRVFGKKALPTQPYMLDALHPNGEGYKAIADEIAAHISLRDVPPLNLNFKGNVYGVDTAAKTITLMTATSQILRKGDTVYIGDRVFVVEEDPTSGGTFHTFTYLGEAPRVVGIAYVSGKTAGGLSASAAERTWNKIKGNQTTTNPVYLKYTIPIASLGWTAAKTYLMEYDFMSRLRGGMVGTHAFLWYNDDPNSIVGGGSYEYNTIPITGEGYEHYQISKNFSMAGYTYLHILIAVTFNATGNFDIEIGDVNLMADGVPVDLGGASKSIYNNPPEISLTTNLFQGDAVLTYRDLLEELRMRGVIQ